MNEWMNEIARYIIYNYTFGMQSPISGIQYFGAGGSAISKLHYTLINFWDINSYLGFYSRGGFYW